MYKKTALKNGLRIITVPIKSVQTAAVLVLVGAGSKYENKNNNGISHFLEHMFFKGTRKRPNTLELIESLDKVGGGYNAFTSQEYTGYWAKVDARHLSLALDWISDIYLNSKLEQEEINRERGTILQELNMYLDAPMSYVGDLWDSLLYGDQPAGWSIIGTEKVIRKARRPDFVDYLNNHYSSKNTVIAVAGKIDSDKTEKEIESLFKGINTAPTAKKESVKGKQSRPASFIYYKDTDQTHLIIGFRGYHLFHPDRYALGLLAVILGGNMSSRMFISVRERKGLAYYISTHNDLDTDSGSWFTRAGVDNSKVEQAIKTIMKEYQKIVREGVSEEELQKAKDYIKGSARISMESSDEQASFYAFGELLMGKILTLEEKFVKIDAVTVDDVKRVACETIRSEKLNLALIGPFKEKDKFNHLLTL